MAEIESAFCRYCLEEIKLNAKVCKHCSRSQHRVVNVLRASDVIASIIAFGVLLVTIWQLNQANEATTKAEIASNKVEAVEVKVAAALKNVLRIEAAVSEASHNICNVARSLADIGEVIPRTTEGGAFQGGSLPEKDKALLKDRIESLRKQISQCK